MVGYSTVRFSLQDDILEPVLIILVGVVAAVMSSEIPPQLSQRWSDAVAMILASSSCSFVCYASVIISGVLAPGYLEPLRMLTP